LVKNQVVSDKKDIRGYDQYLEIEQKKSDTSNEKTVKYTKSKVKDSVEKDELILVNDTEYILNNGKVYEIKKVKGLIYGDYDANTSKVKSLKPAIRKIIGYLTDKPELSGHILWAGPNTDLNIVQSYFPGLSFCNINDLTESSPTDFPVCICNNYIRQIENQEDLINEEINFILELLGPNTDLLCFESKQTYQDILPIIIKNNFKIIEEDPEFSSKFFFVMGIKKQKIEKQGIMVLDTETTGFPNGRDPKDWEKFNSARLIELGYIVYDSTGKKIKEYDSLVKPNNWTITNSFVHGITQDNAITNGKSISDVLADLSEDLDQVGAFVCHNINFDMDIILAESHRAKQMHLVTKIESKRKICTMEIGKKFMKVTKRPKLVELYKFLFKKEFKQEHRALSDCVACADCFFDITC
jgi:DNA polymerase III epsilon subunit-like protein